MASYQSTLTRPASDIVPWPLLAIATVAVMLALPALWNGYPLVYYDSVDYVVMPFTWNMPIYRTAAYGVFALLGRASHSLWALVFAQSAMISYVLYESLRLFAPSSAARLLVIVSAVLCVFTGLPWFTSEIMPDAFTGAVVLGTLTLAFEDGALEAWRRWALAGVLSVGIAVHTTHFALSGGLILCLAASRYLAARGWPLLRPRLHTIVVAFVVALGLAVGSNWLMTGRAFLMQPSAVLTLGLLVQDGLAKSYLDEVCKKSGLDKPTLCMARNRLPSTANEFLWHDDDFWRLGGWTGMQKEASRIVQGCLRDYPFTYALKSLELMLQQLVMIATGDGVTPMQFFIGHAIEKYYPREMPAFSNARQQQGIDFDDINALQIPLLLAAAGALIPLLWLGWRRRDRVIVTLVALTLLAILGNAFVCGALSNPNDRYQSRIIWVPIVVLAIGGARLLGIRRFAFQGESQEPAA
ncbi:MAG TPA: hypothetical protein VKY65_09355 [Alphaproteobacteria bacterium]|nr:hypothetical protein [Alphaproteobacteria bacterium]